MDENKKQNKDDQILSELQGYLKGKMNAGMQQAIKNSNKANVQI